MYLPIVLLSTLFLPLFAQMTTTGESFEATDANEYGVDESGNQDNSKMMMILLMSVIVFVAIMCIVYCRRKDIYRLHSSRGTLRNMEAPTPVSKATP